MKVVSNENIKYGYSLDNTITKNCIYTVISEVDGYYELKNDAGIIKQYDKQYFTPIKEEVMKIKEWKDLDGVSSENGNHFIYCKAADQIEVKNTNRDSLIFIDTEFASAEQIVVVLKAVGLEVEFEKEPTITQNDYNWLVAMRLSDDSRIKRDTACGCLKINGSNILYTLSILGNLEVGKEYLVSDLLKMKVEG
jgi:hypothetical protein